MAIELSSGANTLSREDAVERTVGCMRSDYGSVLNIPDNAQAILNGGEVADDQRLEDGDTLEFVKPSGTKG